MAGKNDVSNFVKKKYFVNKLKRYNQNVTSNKTKDVFVENKLNELSEKVKVISTKGLTKKLINRYKILNGAKYLYS